MADQGLLIARTGAQGLLIVRMDDQGFLIVGMAAQGLLIVRMDDQGLLAVRMAWCQNCWQLWCLLKDPCYNLDGGSKITRDYTSWLYKYFCQSKRFLKNSWPSKWCCKSSWLSRWWYTGTLVSGFRFRIRDNPDDGVRLLKLAGWREGEGLNDSNYRRQQRAQPYFMRLLPLSVQYMFMKLLYCTLVRLAKNTVFLLEK